MALSRSLFFSYTISLGFAKGYGMQKLERKKNRRARIFLKSPCHPVQRLTAVRKRRRFSESARIAPGSSGEDAPTVGASYATTPRAIRVIPENRSRFRATVSVASLELKNSHFSATRLHGPTPRKLDNGTVSFSYTAVGKAYQNNIAS